MRPASERVDLKKFNNNNGSEPTSAASWDFQHRRAAKMRSQNTLCAICPLAGSCAEDMVGEAISVTRTTLKPSSRNSDVSPSHDQRAREPVVIKVIGQQFMSRLDGTVSFSLIHFKLRAGSDQMLCFSLLDANAAVRPVTLSERSVCSRFFNRDEDLESSLVDHV